MFKKIFLHSFFRSTSNNGLYTNKREYSRPFLLFRSISPSQIEHLSEVIEPLIKSDSVKQFVDQPSFMNASVYESLS